MTNSSVGSIHNIRKKFHETHELISTSYHEAGHTVYGLLHYMKIGPVAVFENKRTKRIEGFTHYNSPETNNIKDPVLFYDLLNTEICISYAGLIAEKIHFKLISGSDKFPMFLRDGSSDDTTSAAALIQKHDLVPPGKKRYEYKKCLIKTVTNELEEHWDAVTIISHNLFKKKKLYFADLKNLLTKKTQHKEFWKEQFKAINQIYSNSNGLDENSIKIILSL